MPDRKWIPEDSIDTRCLQTPYGSLEGITVRGLRNIVNDPDMDPDTLVVMCIALDPAAVQQASDLADKAGKNELPQVMTGVGLIYSANQDITLMACHRTGNILKARGTLGP